MSSLISELNAALGGKPMMACVTQPGRGNFAQGDLVEINYPFATVSTGTKTYTGRMVEWPAIDGMDDADTQAVADWLSGKTPEPTAPHVCPECDGTMRVLVYPEDPVRSAYWADCECQS